MCFGHFGPRLNLFSRRAHVQLAVRIDNEELIGAWGYSNYRIFRPESLMHLKPGESFVGPEHGVGERFAFGVTHRRP